MALSLQGSGHGQSKPPRRGWFRRPRMRNLFFFEKKNQKTFACKGPQLDQPSRQMDKVFASFFKKKRFLTTIAIALISHQTSAHDAADAKAVYVKALIVGDQKLRPELFVMDATSVVRNGVYVPDWTDTGR